jgi:pantoate--beta-alanine ligase
MQIVERIEAMRELVREWKEQRLKVALVPTMGYLHEGHMSLVHAAKAQADRVVMSIFVNPLQFGPNEDYERYPRDLERDQKIAQEAGVDALFVPSVQEMYPRANATTVDVHGITDVLCGASRPGHFRGVATVVTKLFQIIQPDLAFFGQKDYQQVAVIRTMVEDLNIPVAIVSCPIVREADGLAMSSRNVYLSPEERNQALSLYRSLQSAQRLVDQGERDVSRIESEVRHIISEQPLADIDYVEIRDTHTLAKLHRIDKEALLALAVRFGKTRLIDNCILQVKSN